jgi:hypothetical protein
MDDLKKPMFWVLVVLMALVGIGTRGISPCDYSFETWRQFGMLPACHENHGWLLVAYWLVGLSI